MNRILIVEDDEFQGFFLYNTILNNYSHWDIILCYNYDDAINAVVNSVVDNNFFDIFLLDIQLGAESEDKSGFDLARKIRNYMPYYRTPLLFLTAASSYGNYALSNFHCYNYITKPYDSDDILQEIEQLMLTGYIFDALEITDTDRIYHRLIPSNIIYVKSAGHSLHIATKDNIIYETRSFSLKYIAEKLGSHFIQCHKQYLINEGYLSNYDRVTKCVKVPNTSIPVGRQYRNTIENMINRRYNS